MKKVTLRKAARKVRHNAFFFQTSAEKKDTFPITMHTQKLLKKLEDMREKKVACDFEIRVGGNSFSVHRNILIASSTYFERLFTSDATEVTDGYIAMENVSSLGIHHCIESIYKGRVEAESQNVEDILQASHLLELEDLKAFCLQYLKTYINPESCLQTSHLFQVYGSQADQSVADAYIASHFPELIGQRDFLEIGEEDFNRYLGHSTHNAEDHWQVLVTWIQHDEGKKEHHFTRTMGHLFERISFSVEFLINKILAHRLVQKSDKAKGLVFQLLTKNDALEKNLNLEMCFTLKDHIRKSKTSNDTKSLENVLNGYLAKYFKHAIENEKFYHLPLKEFTAILDMTRNFNLGHSTHSAEDHWRVLVTWIQQDEWIREHDLTSTMGHLFERISFSVEFLINKILAHRLVQKSDEAKGLVFQLLAKNDALEKNLNLEMCFFLKDNIRKSKISNDTKDLESVLNSYLAKYFKHAIENEKFFHLPLKEFTAILDMKQNSSEERVKWETILKWVTPEESRSNNFPKLMELINFKEIPAGYILTKIRNDPLVAKSAECIGKLCEKAKFCVAPDTLVKLDSGSGILTTFDIESGHQSEITTFQTRETKEKFTTIISLHGNLYSLQNENLYKYAGTEEWEQQATLLSKPSAEFQLVIFQESIYVVERTKMSRYDPSRDIWSEDLPGCRHFPGFCAAASENFIFVIGGYFDWQNAVRFDSESKKWSKIAGPKDGRRGAAAATFCGKVYVLGGSARKTYKTSVECYDERTNQWSEAPSMLIPRAWFTAVVHKGLLYVVGGWENKNSIEVYRKDANVWEEKRQMATPEGDISLSVCTL